jgi:hypothetical protein
MSLVDSIVLAILQGLTELLPVSSSAHVIVAEKLMGLDPSSPPALSEVERVGQPQIGICRRPDQEWASPPRQTHAILSR